MRWLRWIGIALGIILFAWALRTVGWEPVWAQIRSLRWGLLLIVAYYAVIIGLDTWGWRYSFHKKWESKWATLFLARMAGEAVNYVTPAWVAGEPIKAYLLKRRYGVPVSEGLSSVVVAKTTLAGALLIFSVLGLVLAGASGLLPDSLVKISLNVLLGLTLLVGLFLMAQRWGLIRRAVAVTRKKSLQGLRIDGRIRRFYRSQKGRLGLSVLFHFLGWVAGAAEVWLMLHLMGIPITLTEAWVIESLWQLLKAGAFFIPAGVGVQEGGIILIFMALGFPLPAGLAMAVIRRIRELVWAGAGWAVLTGYEYRFSKT